MTFSDRSLLVFPSSLQPHVIRLLLDLFFLVGFHVVIALLSASPVFCCTSLRVRAHVHTRRGLMNRFRLGPSLVRFSRSFLSNFSLLTPLITITVIIRRTTVWRSVESTILFLHPCRLTWHACLCLRTQFSFRLQSKCRRFGDGLVSRMRNSPHERQSRRNLSFPVF